MVLAPVVVGAVLRVGDDGDDADFVEVDLRREVISFLFQTPFLHSTYRHGENEVGELVGQRDVAAEEGAQRVPHVAAVVVEHLCDVHQIVNQLTHVGLRKRA